MTLKNGGVMCQNGVSHGSTEGPAVRALGALDEHAEEHAEAIAARLEHEDDGMRWAAEDAMGAQGEHAKKTV